MKPGNVFTLQLAAAVSDRRRVVVRLGVSLLLGLPFIFINMGAGGQAAGIVMVIMFTGFFGSAVGHARMRQDLRYGRLMLLPTSKSLIWLDLLLSAVVLRLAPVALVLAVFVAVNSQAVGLGLIVVLAGFLCGSLLMLTLIGMAVGQIARSNGEVHLFGALVCGLLAFISGITPLPERLGALEATMAINPVSRLLTALRQAMAGDFSPGGGQTAVAAGIVAVTAVVVGLRWLAGRGNSQELDRSKATADNRAPCETQSG